MQYHSCRENEKRRIFSVAKHLYNSFVHFFGNLDIQGKAHTKDRNGPDSGHSRCGVIQHINSAYAAEFMEQIAEQYAHLFNLHPENVVRGRGHHKSTQQRTYDKLVEYTNKLQKYAEHINTCDPTVLIDLFDPSILLSVELADYFYQKFYC